MKRLLASENGTLQKSQKCRLPKPIQEGKQKLVRRLTTLSPEEFNRDYLKKALPVVVPKPNDFAADWSIASLRQRIGKNQILVRIRTDTDTYRSGHSYALERLSFDKYCENALAGNKKGCSSYLAAQNIPTFFPQLSEELELPAGYVGKKHNGPYLWLAAKGHYEFMHMDPDDNWLVVLEGCKQVRMFPSSNIQRRYPNPLGSGGKTIQSRVDLDLDPEVRANTFPNLNLEAEMMDVKLTAGEMMFIPAFMWHQVTSTEVSLSINIFFGDAGTNAYISKLMCPQGPQWSAFSYWLLNIIEQNRKTPSFQRLISNRLGESLANFFHKQWHEYPTESQTKRLVELVRGYVHSVSEDSQKVKGLVDDSKESPNTSDDNKLIKPAPSRPISKHPPKLRIRGLKWR